jgi:hypothetical protein
MRIVSTVAAVLLAALTAACTTTFEVKDIDPGTQRFKTDSVLPPAAIKTSVAFDVDQTTRLLFIRTNFEDADVVSAYFEDSMKKFGYFERVMRKDEFERFLIANKLQDEVGDVSGFASLSKAAGKIGDFLFVDIDLSAMGYDVTTKLTVYNARDARELYRVEYQVFNWAGLDGVLFQPVMNGFFDWIDANSKKRKAEPLPVPAPTAPAPKAKE